MHIGEGVFFLSFHTFSSNSASVAAGTLSPRILSAGDIILDSACMDFACWISACMEIRLLSFYLHPRCMHLATAGWLPCSNDPRSHAGRSRMLLAGPTKLDRSLGEGPDEGSGLRT